MARLTRKNIKVFAENATNNGIFGSLQANDPTTTNDVEQIQSLPAWSNGWDDATMTSEELPPLEEFQGIQYVVSYEQAYLMQEGLPEWSTSVTYFKGSIVKNITTTGFQIYNSLTDNNTGNLLSDTSNWNLVMDSDNLYAFDSAVVHKTGNETVSGVKTFSSSPIVPNGSGSTDAVNKGQLDTKANTTDVVTLTGNQTITGTKTFTGGVNVNTGNLNLKEGGVYSDTPPLSDQMFGNINFYDSTENSMGFIRSYESTSGDVVCKLEATNGNVSAYLDVGVDVANGKGFVYASPSDYINSVVTTVGISKSSNGFVKFGNGLIIQWGRFLNTNSSFTVTLPTAFSSNNYSITYGQVDDRRSDAHDITTDTTSTTGFTGWISCHSTALYSQWVAIGY